MKKKYLIKTKYGNFNAIIWREVAEKLYLVEVPSFNKTMTQGTTLTDAKYMAQDLIELLCEVAFDEGKVVIDDGRHIVARGKLKNLSGVVALAA
ncbi:type II toxin-antitoxin system HicB family antitoxin [Candidatus Kaiserbacteria bacterium]|nr:type II toxin-antitoxin system HicB family antitoxin [Candidatus Kaiserbacteria bacterium]